MGRGKRPGEEWNNQPRVTKDREDRRETGRQERTPERSNGQTQRPGEQWTPEARHHGGRMSIVERKETQYRDRERKHRTAGAWQSGQANARAIAPADRPNGLPPAAHRSERVLARTRATGALSNCRPTGARVTRANQGNECGSPGSPRRGSGSPTRHCQAPRLSQDCRRLTLRTRSQPTDKERRDPPR
jgi:hypothetical protein